MNACPVPAGQLATVVTELTMATRPRPAPFPESHLTLRRWASPALDRYRLLFTRVGAPWLWFSRLVLSDDALRAEICDPRVEVYAVLDRQIEVGLVELDLRSTGCCILTYFGLVPELTGQRHGRWMMAHALALAWRPNVERVSLRSCTLDHPSALNFYRQQGFVATARSVEVFVDPRLTGHLPRHCAPQIPLLAALVARDVVD